MNMLVMGWLLIRIENLRYLLNPSDCNRTFLVSGSLIPLSGDRGSEVEGYQNLSGQIGLPDLPYYNNSLK